MNESTPLKLAVVGAGPVGLALALHAAEGPARRGDHAVRRAPGRQGRGRRSAHARALARQRAAAGAPRRLARRKARSRSLEVHVSQQAPSLAAAFTSRFGEPELTIRASDEGVPMLGAVLSYGAIVAPLQEVWLAAVAREPKRLFSRFGAPRRGAEERRRAGGRRGRRRHRRALRPGRRRRGRRVRRRGEAGARRRPTQPGAAPRLRPDRMGRASPRSRRGRRRPGPTPTTSPTSASPATGRRRCCR